jgi:hypothetical protein
MVMSDHQYTPWDEVFGPSTPENLVIPTPIPIPTPEPVVPIPTPVVPAPVPVNPVPATPTVQKAGSWTTIAATLIVAVGVGVAGYFIANKKTDNVPTPVTPSGPVLPVVDQTLKNLLPDDKARGFAASYFRDVSDFLSTTKALTTTGEVREAVQAASKDLQAAIGAQGWANINTPISNRIATVLGGTAGNIPDIPLDTPMQNGVTPRQALVKEYAQIAVDCRGG